MLCNEQLAALSLRLLPGPLWCMSLQAGPYGYDTTPDVWLQLLEHCADSPERQPAIIYNMARQLAEQQATNSQQQQVNAALQEQLAEQQQDITSLQQQLAEQQQVNGALQEQVASQGAQLQALQAKVEGWLLQG